MKTLKTSKPLTRRRWTPERARRILAQCRAARSALHDRRASWRAFCDEYEQLTDTEQGLILRDLGLTSLRRDQFDYA